MRNSSRRKVCLSSTAAIFLISCGLALAQTGDGGQTSGSSNSGPTLNRRPEQNSADIAVRVKVVNVLATVRDKHGKIVSDLTANDFTLLEDTKPVTIRYFARDTDLPLTTGLLVDTSLSQRDSIDQEKSASKTFFDQVLREKDTAFLIHFDKEVELLQDLTSSKPKLESALDAVAIRSLRDEDDSARNAGGGTDDDDSQRRSGGRGAHHGGTDLYDAIYLASDEIMKKQQGRKALIVLSDGVDRGSKETIESAIESAQKSDTLIYCVLFKGEEANRGNGGFGFPRMGGPMGGGGGPMGGGGRRHGGGYPQEERPDGKKIMQRLAKETGGHFFEASKKQPIDAIYKTVEDELRNEYSLGFSPEKSDSAGYHKLQLKTQHKDDEIQARDGFYLE